MEFFFICFSERDAEFENIPENAPSERDAEFENIPENAPSAIRALWGFGGGGICRPRLPRFIGIANCRRLAGLKRKVAKFSFLIKSSFEMDKCQRKSLKLSECALSESFHFAGSEGFARAKTLYKFQMDQLCGAAH